MDGQGVYDNFPFIKRMSDSAGGHGSGTEPRVCRVDVMRPTRSVGAA